jgi:uncharacterized repeat protein (TIGR03806 family)
MLKWCFYLLTAFTCLALPNGTPALAAQVVPQPVDIADLPDGFSEKIVVRGITGATAMAIAPDGRIFVCEQPGILRVVEGNKLLRQPFVKVDVDSYWERGLIGVALDPGFPKNPYVYLCYVSPNPYPHHRISRFTARGNTAVSGSETMLLEGDDQTKLGGETPAGHQGGAIHFGQDGKLYIAIGEQTAGAPAQRLDTFQGKLLRINSDGSIPADNPFYKTTKGKYRAIWALGLRNPFTFAVQPGTGRIFINDVGDARWEEINEGSASANYGWPFAEGPSTNPKYQGPVHAYDHSVGRSIAGGVFYNPSIEQFPHQFVGKYFFADYMDNWIRILDPEKPRTAQVFATGVLGPVDLQLGPDGSLYYLSRNAWVKDDKFVPRTGSLHRISYTARSGHPAPALTSQPEEQIVAASESATFSVTSKGEKPLRYQWQRDGSPIMGAVTPSYTLSQATSADHGARFRCVVSNAHGSTKTRPATLWVASLRAPAAVGSVVPGLDYAAFKIRGSGLPEFASLKPCESGTTAEVGVALRGKDEHFALAYQGYLDIAKDGAYKFWVRSSGASKLFVSGMEVTSAGASGSTRAVSGTIALSAGKHSFLLLFAHNSGRPNLELAYARPGLGVRPIPASAFCRSKDASITAASFRIPGNGSGCRELITSLHVPENPADLPPLLSETGIFRSLDTLTPNSGIISYDVNVPFWSDGAAKQRWMAVPGGAQLGFAPTGPWRFPAGTAFIKHFELTQGPAQPTVRKRIETRLLVLDRSGNGYGVTYKWRPDGTDADLLLDGLMEKLPIRSPSGLPMMTWTYPSRGDCLVCHNPRAGFVLGANTRQLNRALAPGGASAANNQILAWNRLGLFTEPLNEAALARLPKLAAIQDHTASLEHRVRSYLDVNCAHCHCPGGTRAEFDARFQTPLPQQKILNGQAVTGILGLPGAKIIIPGDPSRSELFIRMMRRQDTFGMPPLATREVDSEALGAVSRWIQGLPFTPPPYHP